MDNTPSHISPGEWELFDQYGLDRMTTVQRAEFEERIDRDSSLRLKFEDYKATVRAVEESGLRDRMEEFHEGFESPRGGKLISLLQNSRIHWAAAVLIAVLAIPVWLQVQDPGGKRLYDKYYRPDPGLPTFMGVQDNYLFYEAMVDYKKGDYLSAIAKWEQLNREGMVSDTLSYFLGMANLAQGEDEKAIEYLSPLLKNSTAVFRSETYYYLGMSFLKKGKMEQAIQYLEKSNTPEAHQVLLDLLN